MTFWEAVLLGIVQGVFMFVPVSSTAHLVLAQHLLILMGSDIPPPESAEMVLFDLVVHLGTLVSIVIVFRRSLTIFLLRMMEETRDWIRGRRCAIPDGLYARLFALGLLTTFVTGTVGLVLKVFFETGFANPAWLGATFTITGGLLWWTDKLKPRRVGLRQIGVKVAVVIGLAQAAALMPGLSRSGMTIVFALLMGLRRRWAAEYSFFVAFPTIIAASLVQSLLVMRDRGVEGFDLVPLLTGFVVAGIVGAGALKLVVALLHRAQLKWFSLYLWALAILVLFGFFERF